MSGEDDLRKPTDHEQALIAAVYTARAAVESKRFTVLGVGMGRALIEDDRGRWTTMFGLPVIETRLSDNTLVLLVDVPHAVEVTDPVQP